MLSFLGLWNEIYFSNGFHLEKKTNSFQNCLKWPFDFDSNSKQTDAGCTFKTFGKVHPF